MSWSYLSPILEKLSNNSTLLGKYWAAIVIFRFVILNTFIESIWGDEFSSFLCNTKEIGCDHLCFNKLTPISNVRLWGLQLMWISLPAGLYLVYIWHLVSRNEDDSEADTPNSGAEGESQKGKNKNKCSTPSLCSGLRNGSFTSLSSLKKDNGRDRGDQDRGMPKNQRNRRTRRSSITSLNFTKNRANYIPDWYVKPVKKDTRKYFEYEKIKKSIMPLEFQKISSAHQKNERNIWKFYYLQVFLRLFIDFAFTYAQYTAYPYNKSVPAFYTCHIPDLCTNHKIDCYVSRPFEKTLFFHGMGVLSCLAILVSVLELCKLGLVRLYYLLFHGFYQKNLEEKGFESKTIVRNSNDNNDSKQLKQAWTITINDDYKNSQKKRKEKVLNEPMMKYV